MGHCVTLIISNSDVTKDMTRRCAQISAVGPMLWNIFFAMFLNFPYEDGISQELMLMSGIYWLRETLDLTLRCSPE